METKNNKTQTRLKETGEIPGIVERWNGWAGIRQDLHGFIDLISFHPGGCRIIQATDMDGKQAHIEKIVSNRYAQQICKWDKNPIELWCWRKVKKQNSEGKRGRQSIWKPQIVRFKWDEEHGMIPYILEGDG